MAVVGEASVRIVGNLKPLSDSLAQAKKMTKDFDAAINASMKKTSSLLRNINNVKPKVDFSSVVKMNQSFDNAIRRIDTINKKTIKPKTELPSAGFFKGFSDSAESANTSVNKLDQSLKRIASVTAGYLGVRELQRYADAWTSIGNQLAAASQISGMQARSLQDLNKLANESRSGIEATANLYARLMRSTAGVAKSEEEIAKATDAVNKAFKAGGAAASEQAAGIMQLGQALGSGFLQGDELRSIRENAPLVAQAIADEFKTTIAGLKDLGAEGKLTSDRVFKALLNAHEGINKTFATTNATIADGFTRINNAMTEYVGLADKTNGVTVTLNKVLNYIADNFATAADMASKFAAVIAGALVGRSLGTMAASLGLAAGNLVKFTNSLRAASAVAGTSSIAFGSLAAAAGPITALIGGIASVAAFTYFSSVNEAAEKTEKWKEELFDLGLISKETAGQIEETAKSLDKLSEADTVRKIKSVREELEKIQNDLIKMERAGASKAFSFFSSTEDKEAGKKIQEIFSALREGSVSAKDARIELEKIATTNVSQPIVDLSKEALKVVDLLGGLQTIQAQLGDAPGLDELNNKLAVFRETVGDAANAVVFSPEQDKQLADAIAKFEETGVVSEDLKKLIANLGAQYPDLGGWLKGLNDLLGKISQVRAEAAALKAENVGNIPLPKETYADPHDRQYVETDKVNEYIKAQKDSTSLSEREVKLRKEIDNQLKNALKSNINLTQEQAKQLALEKLAQQDRFAADRKAERERNKKPKKEKKEQLNEYQKELRQIEEKVAILQAEQAVLEAVNPAVNDYGFAMARATQAQELLSAAKRAGLEVSKQQLTLEQLLSGEFGHLTGKAREQAEAMYFAADSFAAATANGNELKEKVKEIQDEYETLRESSRSAMTGFVTDMVKGKSAAEALSNALGKLADALLKVGLDILFGASGSGGFGAIGKLFGFASGGYTGDGGKYEPAGVVHKGEFVFSKEATKNLGIDKLHQLHNSAKRGFASGGYVGGFSAPSSSNYSSSRASNQSVNGDIRVYVDEDGNWQAKVEEISFGVSQDVTEKGIKSYDQIMPDRVQQIQTSPRRR